MEQKILILLILLSFKLFNQTLPYGDKHWQLVFNEEFNDYPLNASIWNVMHNWDHNFPDENNILNVYLNNLEPVVCTNRPENVSIYEDAVTHEKYLRFSVLNIPYNCNDCDSNDINVSDCRRECRNHGLSYPYTAGMIESKDLGILTDGTDIKYGYIEAEISMSDVAGLWPAFWTCNGHNEITPYNEIDIFEMCSGRFEECNRVSAYHKIHDKNIMTTCIHPALKSSDGPSCYGSYYVTHSIDDYTKPHVYGLEWSPTKIIWYVDGKIIRNTPINKIINPQKIILGMGVHSPSDISFDPNAVFPLNMYVNYVRIYKLKSDCENFIDECNYDFSSYDAKSKKYIKIGGNNCVNSINAGDNIFLRASQFVELSEDFNVPLGASFYADANDECLDVHKPGCDEIFYQCNNVNFDPANWQNYYSSYIKKEIYLGGTGCNLEITPAYGNIYFLATDKITVNGEVKLIPSTYSDIKLKIVNCE